MSGPDITPGADRGQAPVGLAAVGLGRWARVMAQAYADTPLVDLRTCFTRNPERRQAFAADFGCGQDESLDAVLARDDVDGIVITAPNDQHAPIIEAAAAHGKHVYTEKPV
ncbi:MAG TPA: Gfo/Idh/MocA family oxidoreductase, partial [bacterium]|nr:Gfo/Idh/MocA family oxidoreductase [bacterium]